MSKFRFSDVVKVAVGSMPAARAAVFQAAVAATIALAAPVAAAGGTAQSTEGSSRAPTIERGMEPFSTFGNVLNNPSRPSCLEPQLRNRQAGERIAESSVFLVVKDSAGTVFSVGSGTVVANSSNHQNPHNRILTALHVASSFGLVNPRTAQIEVFSSNGLHVGTSRLAAHSQPRGQNIDEIETNSDVAVLEVTPTSFAYHQIRGLELAPRISNFAMTGISDIGIVGGMSGAAALNSRGQIEGVFSSVLTSGQQNHTTHQAPSMEQVANGGWNRVPLSNVSLPKRSRAFFASIADTNILGALGEAGRTAAISSMPSEARTGANNETVTFTVAGYPAAHCVVSPSIRAQVLDTTGQSPVHLTMEEPASAGRLVAGQNRARAAVQSQRTPKPGNTLSTSALAEDMEARAPRM